MSWNITKAVSAAVLRRNQVLLIRREKQPYLGKWTLPGGKIQRNETVEQAMIREVEEQTGYLINRRVTDFIPIITTPEGFVDILPGDRLGFPLLTAAWQTYAKLDAKEKIQTTWLSPEQMSLMDEKEFTPGLRQILRRVLSSVRTR